MKDKINKRRQVEKHTTTATKKMCKNYPYSLINGETSGE